jgi:hypothetical protein
VLARIERTNLILAAVVTCLAGLLWGPRGALGAGAGALLACADFYVLVRLVGRLTANVRAGGSAAGLGALLFAKTTLLFGLVFLAIRVAGPVADPVRPRFLCLRHLDRAARALQPGAAGGLMGPHATWFDFIPGYPGFRSGLQESLGRTWTWQVFQSTHFQLDHVMCALVVLAFLALGAFRYATAVGGSATRAWSRRRSWACATCSRSSPTRCWA